MNGIKQTAESLLRFPRAARTVLSAARFNKDSADPAVTDGDDNWRMRSAMDLHPRAGRVMSRLAIRHSQGGIPRISQARSSNFIDPTEIQRCVEALKTDGMYLFENRMPAEAVARMQASALAVPSIPRGIETMPAPYPRSAPEVGRYDIDEQFTMASAEMQDYCSDPALALIAATYLRQPVIQDQTALWWTTTQGVRDAALNAWLFHQDRDRLSFLKFFVYLTDVGPENGPHTYVRGTHRHIPRSLASDGRKTDELIQQAGLWDQVVSLSGPAGTMLAVDTVGLHKGLPPSVGDRCVLQVEFATSLFGAQAEYPLFVPTPQSAMRYLEMPGILQRWKPAMIASEQARTTSA